MLMSRVREIASRWRRRRGTPSAKVSPCRCAGTCRCASLVPYLLHRELELETEFFRGVM